MNVNLAHPVLVCRPLNIIPNNQSISGTTQDGAGNPVGRPVLLMREVSGNIGNLGPPVYSQEQVIKSKPDGTWQFGYLYPGRYTVVAYDPSGQFDPVIKGGLVAEPME